MTNKHLLLIIAILFSFQFYACKKDREADTTKPLITVVEPLSGDTLSMTASPEVHVEFTVTDESELASLSVLLIKNNSDTLMNDLPSVHGLKVYAFHEHVIPAGIAALTPMKAIILASDHSGNTESKTINFFIEP